MEHDWVLKAYRSFCQAAHRQWPLGKRVCHVIALREFSASVLNLPCAHVFITSCFSQEAGNTRELHENVVRVDNLRPLTVYEFQMRVCHSRVRRTNTPMLRSPIGQRSLCSTWSPSVRGRSPGKGNLLLIMQTNNQIVKMSGRFVITHKTDHL